MGDTSDVGRRTGMLMTVMTVGAVVGPPISGAIYSRTGGFDYVGVYAGELKLPCVFEEGRAETDSSVCNIRADDLLIRGSHVRRAMEGPRWIEGKILICEGSTKLWVQ